MTPVRVCVSLALALTFAAGVTAQQPAHRDPSVCVGPNAGATLARPLAPGDLLNWCQPEATTAVTFTATALTKQGATLVEALAGVSCRPIAGGMDCRAPVPPAFIAALPASLTLSATRFGVASPSSAALQVDPTIPRTCRYTPPGATIAETRPLDTAIGGYMSNDLQAVAVRVGQLRRDGWRVEWQYTESSGPPRLVVMMWCAGVPQ